MSFDEQNTDKILKREELLGYASHWPTVSKLVASQRFPQVVMLVGRKGMGKTHFAYHIAAQHLCSTRTGCQSCDPCKQVLNRLHRDVFALDGDSPRLKLQDADQVAVHLDVLPSQLGGRRVVIVADVDRFTEQAVNRLLKTVEEPPEASLIIMTTSKKNQIKSTLKSRAVPWPIAQLQQSELEELVAKSSYRQRYEDLPLPDRAQALKMSGFAPGLLLSLLAEGLERHQRLRQLVLSILENEDIAAIMESSEQLAKTEGVTAEEFLPLCEQALNYLYTQKAKEPALHDRRRLLVLFNRRHFLKELNQLVRKKKIVLNSQLAVERLGMIHCKEIYARH